MAWSEERDTERVVRQFDRTRAEEASRNARLDAYRENRESYVRQRTEARRAFSLERRERARDFPMDRTTDRFYQPIEPLGTIRP